MVSAQMVGYKINSHFLPQHGLEGKFKNITNFLSDYFQDKILTTKKSKNVS